MATTTGSTDKNAVLALVLAFVLPPVGLLLAVYGGDKHGRRSGLRGLAVAVGATLTVMSLLIGIMLLGTAGQ